MASRNQCHKDDWVLCPSKSLPGRYYYFNVKSGETVWSMNDEPNNSKLTDCNPHMTSNSHGRAPQVVHDVPAQPPMHGLMVWAPFQVMQPIEMMQSGMMHHIPMLSQAPLMTSNTMDAQNQIQNDQAEHRATFQTSKSLSKRFSQYYNTPNTSNDNNTNLSQQNVHCGDHNQEPAERLNFHESKSISDSKKRQLLAKSRNSAEKIQGWSEGKKIKTSRSEKRVTFDYELEKDSGLASEADIYQNDAPTGSPILGTRPWVGRDSHLNERFHDSITPNSLARGAPFLRPGVPNSYGMAETTAEPPQPSPYMMNLTIHVPSSGRARRIQLGHQ